MRMGVPWLQCRFRDITLLRNSLSNFAAHIGLSKSFVSCVSMQFVHPYA